MLYLMNLNPKLWSEEQKLDPIVRDRLLRIAAKFFEFTKIKQPFSDVILTGSSANYNWTSKSDIDLHLIFDYTKINENTDLVKEYMWAHKVAWNDEHEITIKKFPVEVYAQDSNEAHYSTGVYSVLQDKWLKKPSKEKHVVDKVAIEHKAKPLEYEIDAAIKTADYDKLVKIVEKLKAMRTAGLEKGGEYSLENLVFKHLRRNGYLEKLTTARDKALDEQLTLEKQMNKTKTMIVANVLKEAQIIETIWKEFQDDEGKGVLAQGHFAKESDLDLYFHGFSSLEHLLKALKTGVFGRQNLTSIGNEYSHGVPHYYRIWFKPKIKIYPKFYSRKGDPVQIKQEIVKKFSLDDWLKAEMSGIQYERENEWYVNKKINFNDIEIKMITYPPSVAKLNLELLKELREICAEKGYSISDDSHWFKEMTAV